MSASECEHCLVFMRDLGAFLEGWMSMRALALSSFDLGELFGLALELALGEILLVDDAYVLD